MLNNLKKGVYLGSMLLIMAGCQSKQNKGSSIEQVRQAINHQNQVFMDSYKNNDLDTFADLYTEHGKMMPPNMEAVSDHDGIKRLMQGMQKSGVSAIEIGTDELYLVSDGAVEVGHYTVKVGDGQVVDNGKSMVYWKKDGDTWRMFRDIWNSNRPPAPSSNNQSE